MSQTPPQHPTQEVFERVTARPVFAPDHQHGRLVHLSWSAPQQGGRLVQVYDNGGWLGYSASPVDREAWLLLDAAVHHEIELLAVEPSDASISLPHWLAGVDPPTRTSARISLLRDTSLPFDSLLQATLDGQATQATPMFAAETPRGGFGAVFGEGGFGYDASTGPGLGLGELGYGPLGIDGDALSWQDATSLPGPHVLTVGLINKEGDPVTGDLEIAFETVRLPDPPSNVTLHPNLLLTWT